ncbi:hypothetical protein OU997_00875 [Pseudomonas sp. SL4(2022)]|uniref:hypothetical protein n=1 Tax=Pseudomonas sp. SL4(2022) TaxID=2994661 RepID=UPI0022701408|nr:hypothetical protein [Pseudomonas sp. SL4(2022)]WAC44787.1 hypothetical protein OU997_00875 [Pseudomonas sp. SL4(2022)]
MNTLNFLRYIPIFLVLAVYLPASILGIFAFQDRYALNLLLILFLFLAIYLIGYRWAAIATDAIRSILSRGRVLNFGLFLAFVSLVYLIVTAYAIVTADAVPLIVAFSGGSEMDIANARASYLSSREGYESIIRYVSFIASRAIIPMVVLYLFFWRNELRFFFLIAVMFIYSLTLEKVVPVFAMLPLFVFYFLSRQFLACFYVFLSIFSLIFLLSWISYGGLHEGQVIEDSRNQSVSSSLQFPEGVLIKGPVENSERLYLKCVVPLMFLNKEDFDCFDSAYTLDLVLVDRVLWVPYITAYDWLVFQDVGLKGRLTMGRSVSLVHRLFGEPKMQLEKIIYAYQRGASPGGAGTANTLFLIDAKLAFGWLGVVIYSFVLVFCAAIIFSSSNLVLKLASINSFLVVVVSPLTATLLSGGLAIFVILALFLPSDDSASNDEIAVRL